MNTDTTWNPPTLADAINNGYVCNFTSKKPIKNSHKTKYQCPDCQVFCWPACFDDVRQIFGIDSDFICDGCFTKMQRNLVDIDGDGKPDTLIQFKQKYLKAHNSPIN